MPVFELWVDESGDFENDGNGTDSPSVVGGILFQEGALTDDSAAQLLDEVKERHGISGWVHGTDIPRKKYGHFSTDLLSEVKEQGIQLVVFENEERLEIVNGDLTYLNIIAEGIIQLIQTLSMEHEEFQLLIVAANRQKREGAEERKQILLIEDHEYINRLKERITLGMARRNMTNGNWSWTFERKSARKDHRLMISDVICHSWFRKNGTKFNEEQRSILLGLYNPFYCFTVFEHATYASIKRSVLDGSIGNAIFEWAIANAQIGLKDYLKKAAVTAEIFEKNSKVLEIILVRMQKLPNLALNTHLAQVINNIQSLVEIDRDFHKAGQILDQIKELFIPKMIECGICSNAFFFKINILLLDIANHQGNIVKAESLIKECRQLLPQFAGRWENIDDVLDFLVREAVHKSNIYDFNGAIESMEQVQHFIDGTFELFPIGLQDELSVMTKEMKSDILGKVAGTRLQARTFLGRLDQEQLIEARKESELAMNQFDDKDDINRQYQYRSQLECEAGKFDESLVWLQRSFNLPAIEDVHPGRLLEAMAASAKVPFVFGCMHYTRLMAEAAFREEFAFADEMYKEWIKASIEEKLFHGDTSEHPYEIILWKIGSYLIQRNSLNASLEKYEAAMDICSLAPHRLTIKTIGLGIAMERAGFLIKYSGPKFKEQARKAVREVTKIYESILEVTNLPIEMKKYFLNWKESFDRLQCLDDEQKANLYLELSRKIPY